MRLYKNDSVRSALKKLGVEKLHLWQNEVMPIVYQGDDLFLSVPTSGGKSLTYQLPAILETGQTLTLVISPLRALQQDQVMQLTERGVAAACLNSDLGKRDRKELLAHLPELCLLYLAPEQLSAKDFRKALKQCNVERVVVDEAHMLPQAAPSFRKAYGEIGHFIRGFPHPPQIIACTATSTNKERKTIIKSLEMENPEIYSYPFRRENLRLSVKKVSVPPRCKNKQSELEKQLFHSVEAALLDWNGKGSAICTARP